MRDWKRGAGIVLLSMAAITARAASGWQDVAHWPDFTGGVWESPGADGSPHAEDLPLNAVAQQLIKKTAAHYGSGAGSCAPRGMPWNLGNQFIYSRGLILILGAPDYYQVLRRVYMDGRAHDDPDPTYFGHSIGRWEGKTLVIDTVGFLPEELLTEGLPSYGKTHIVERYRLLAPGKLQLDLKVSNPALLTHDWTQRRVYTLHKGEDVPESYCANNRDAGGVTNLAPPPTLEPLPGAP
ncbi:MAG TPA: hypothetical protein VMI92_07060 [Steroidobacteraceae bacterium]|nr:hypothetical protein [Steroidobacteraceae bacterium]